MIEQHITLCFSKMLGYKVSYVYVFQSFEMDKLII